MENRSSQGKSYNQPDVHSVSFLQHSSFFSASSCSSTSYSLLLNSLSVVLNPVSPPATSSHCLFSPSGSVSHFCRTSYSFLPQPGHLWGGRGWCEQAVRLILDQKLHFEIVHMVPKASDVFIAILLWSGAHAHCLCTLKPREVSNTTPFNLTLTSSCIFLLHALVHFFQNFP